MPRHERHPLPPHEREGHLHDEPTHGELMEKMEIIEDLLRRIEEKR
ncbi:MAG: hypothetical protein ABH864_06040 [archaeon]